MLHDDLGVILEVAEKKCGGPEKLSAAMARGDVVKALSENQKHVLYYFPSVALMRKSPLHIMSL